MKTRPWKSGLAGVGLLDSPGSGARAGGQPSRSAPDDARSRRRHLRRALLRRATTRPTSNRPPADRKVTMIMNVVPGQEPSSGPNYYAFDDNVLYQFNVDNDRDGTADDVIYQVRFQTEVRTPGQFLATLGGGPLPPMSAIDGPGSEGMSRVQRYTVTELRDCKERAQGAEVPAEHRALRRRSSSPRCRPTSVRARCRTYASAAAAGHPHRRGDRHPRLRRPVAARPSPSTSAPSSTPSTCASRTPRRSRWLRPPLPGADGGRGRERLREPVRHQRLQRLQRELDRRSRCRSRASRRTARRPTWRTACVGLYASTLAPGAHRARRRARPRARGPAAAQGRPRTSCRSRAWATRW